MAVPIVEILSKSYDSDHGVVNVRPVVDALIESKDPLGEIQEIWNTVEQRWRAPILEAMRALAASGRGVQQQGDQIIEATDIVAADSGADEYYKSVNAMVVSKEMARALPKYIKGWLERDLEFYHRLALYTSGMLIERNLGFLLKDIRPDLESAAHAESSLKLKGQLMELLKQL